MEGLLTAEYPYVTTPKTIKEFFPHVQTAGVPSKVTQQYLGSVGFKSKNDRRVIGLLKDLGFIGSDGAPTNRWRDYKNRDLSKKVMGKAILEAYSELFATYPDAPRRDREALLNFFRSKTGLAERTVNAISDTFRTICELAQFEGLDELPELEEQEELGKNRAQIRTPATRIRGGGPSVSINIELQLPATENQEIYDKLFASLRKHLFPDETEN